MPNPTLRTWIDVDLDAVKKNFFTACSLTDAVVTCVLKANAYGHGDVPVARALHEAGCRSFAVSCAREALRLRHFGIPGEILVMGLAEEDLLPELIEQDVTLTLADPEGFLSAEAAAVQAGKPAVAHVKLDTGFHRLGFACDAQSAKRIAALVQACPHVRTEGLYSHLGLISEERDRAQYARFMDMRQQLLDLGVPVHDFHLCDSIGLIRYPAWHMDRCRVGAFLFGVRPSRSAHLPFEDLETLRFCTTVAQVRDVEAGEPVGYGDDDVADHPIRVATLCAGYGDGYPRHLSNGRGQVLIRGRRARVVGLVCMDQMMVDVTDIPECRSGDTAVLLGGGIGYQEMADWAGTNRNECLTILSRRPLRVYHEQGKPDRTLDALSMNEEDA